MGKLQKNILLRFFMAVCALAQLAATMPHHHHDAFGTPCINLFHGFEIHSPGDFSHHPELCCDTGETGQSAPYDRDGCGDACRAECTGHLCLHNTAGHGDGDCTVVNIDLDSPVREEISFGVSSLQILLWTTSTADMPLAGNGNSADGHRRAVEYGTAYGGTLSLYRSYIARATPPRAPSFLA